jgi:NAD-dependent SIR2 family protein deacetylase
MLEEARKVVVMTGAGISTSAGIPVSIFNDIDLPNFDD